MRKEIDGNYSAKKVMNYFRRMRCKMERSIKSIPSWYIQTFRSIRHCRYKYHPHY